MNALTIGHAPLAGRIAAASLFRRVVPIAALIAVVAPIAWLVLTAANAPSVLTPTAIRGGTSGQWTLGPLHGLLDGTPGGARVLHRQMLVVLIVVGAGWLVAWMTARWVSLSVLVGGVVCAHAVLLLAPPLPLTDVLNYELYGRMATVHGLNPYLAAPAQVPHDAIYALTNWHHLRSPYGPLFTLATEGLGIFGTQGWLWAWKVVVVASSLGAIGLAAAVAGRLGVSRRRVVAAVGLSPVLLIAEVGGLHQDMLAMVCLLGAAWCIVRGRDEYAPAWTSPLAGALVVAAAAIKPSFVLVVGVVVLGASHRQRAVAGAATAAAVVGAIDLLAFGGALPALSSQAELVSPVSVPNLLGLAAGHGGADGAVRTVAQAALVALAIGATIAVGLRRERVLGALAVVLFGSVLLISWVMPWYLVWALPFLALTRRRVLVALVVAATCWLTLGGLSTLPGVLHAAGYFPTRLATGHANHQTFQRLVR